MLPSSIEETSNKPYSNWDENANALLAGIVQGVVVQIKILAPLKSLSPFKIGKLTHIVGDACSRYSTSASANAVFQQLTTSLVLSPYIGHHSLKTYGTLQQ